MVFEGGASRTAFSCGVMDAFLEEELMPDYFIGVSAGIAFGVSYLSKQKGRNLKILEEYMACLLYTSPSPRDRTRSRMPSSA